VRACYRIIALDLVLELVLRNGITGRQAREDEIEFENEED
jgi:hypothetical protein